jgi:energy-coupling factor transporter ATP-binding protein EcfA2
MDGDFQSRKHALNISGGERQRLLVAQIIAADPEVVILDEPSKGLDRAARLLIFNALAQRFNGTAGPPPTLICADHDFAALYRHFDYVFEIGHGVQTLVWEKASASPRKMLETRATVP